jgi:hypothetical protein
MGYLVVASWDANFKITGMAHAVDEADAIRLQAIMVEEGHADAFYDVMPVGSGLFSTADPVAQTVTFDKEGYDQRNALAEWEGKRVRGYGSIGAQLDMQYWDGVNDTTVWVDHVAKVKSDHPKPT